MGSGISKERGRMLADDRIAFMVEEGVGMSAIIVEVSSHPKLSGRFPPDANHITLYSMDTQTKILLA